jgi:flagellar M-ring protein FliF
VLVDEPANWEGHDGSLRRVVTPPSPETMTRITDVVSAAAGIVPERGDRLVVESLPFETNQEPPPAALQQRPKTGWPVNWEQVVSVIALVAVLAAMVYVLRTRRKAELLKAEPAAAALPAPQPAAPAAAVEAPQTSMEQLARQLEDKRREREQMRQRELAETGAALKSLADGAIELANTNSELCAGVLRNWLREAPPEQVS